MPDKLKYIVITLLAMLCFSAAKAAEECNIADSIPHVVRQSVTIPIDSTIMEPNDSILVADSIAFANKPWYKQLYDTGFMLHDKRIKYPRFARFLLRIYYWGDKTFNSYRPEYVQATGKNWKVTGRSYNWMESYMMLFSEKSSDILHINSDLYTDVGLYISFMAVSAGYTAKTSDIFGGKKNNRSNFNFNFTCSRIFANLDITSTKGNTHITRFGDYKGDLLPYDFDAIDHKNVSAEAFYIFNFGRYSHAAAFCFSKYQLKSAGSWLLGISYSHQNINFNFSSLPQEMKDYLPVLGMNYKYRYTDYGICGGYAYNWAIRPQKWLLNVTVFPSAGYRRFFHDSTDDERSMFATSAHARLSVVYNHKALFASLMGRFDGNLYFTKRYTFFNSIESLSLVVGARF